MPYYLMTNKNESKDVYKRQTYKYAPFTGELVSASHNDATPGWKFTYNAKTGEIILTGSPVIITPVSYTHLDVYKRQYHYSSGNMTQSPLNHFNL